MRAFQRITLVTLAAILVATGCTTNTSNPQVIAIDQDRANTQLSATKSANLTSKPLGHDQSKAIRRDQEVSKPANTAPADKMLATRSESRGKAALPHALSHQLELEAPRLRQRIATQPTFTTGVLPLANQWAAHTYAIRGNQEPVDREQYAHYTPNPVIRTSESPVSTFSIDVDTGSYANVRRILRQGRLPIHDAVRVEEFINYFNYRYPQPDSRKTPFNVITEIGPSPWNEHTHLLHIGIKGYDVARENLPPANLVFLIDVSGSMRSKDKLGLLKISLKLLTQRLREQDRISLVVYAGASGVVLEPTAGHQRAKILSALDGLTAGGSTNGGAGIHLAYAMAKQAYIPNGINRILLATDGDFNVGTVNFAALKNLVEEQRKTGISLTSLGFGSGNYNDRLMEQLADAGNGNYAYIDSLNEAQKVLVDEMGSTLQTIAKDVKIQIEFNPQVVAEYRLIGYENRALRREDFNNDKIDAGEIGAGHTVTALYEIALQGSQGQSIDPLRYGHREIKSIKLRSLSENREPRPKELAFLRIRFKQPNGSVSQLIETPLLRASISNDSATLSTQFRFAASVAAFGQLLKGGTYMKNYGLKDILTLARQSKGDDPFGYRGEFISMVNLAMSLSVEPAKPTDLVQQSRLSN